jgi:hypothetical protein
VRHSNAHHSPLLHTNLCKNTIQAHHKSPCKETFARTFTEQLPGEGHNNVGSRSCNQQSVRTVATFMTIQLTLKTMFIRVSTTLRLHLQHLVLYKKRGLAMVRPSIFTFIAVFLFGTLTDAIGCWDQRGPRGVRCVAIGTNCPCGFRSVFYNDPYPCKSGERCCI